MGNRPIDMTTPAPARIRRAFGPAGFTILEVVITFIIIGVLTLVLVPVISNRSEQAKIASTQQDLNHLADAQERAAFDTSWFYRPYVLNDQRAGDGQVNSSPLDRVQGIRDNLLTTDNIYENPAVIFISTRFLDYPSNQAQLFARLGTRETDLGVQFNWNGPYINWFRDVNQNDWPDDAWGGDYLFFTPAGVLYPPDPFLRPTDIDVSDEFEEEGPMVDVESASGSGTTNRTFSAFVDGGQTPLFDRPTWLSLGPDGLPGNGTDDPNNVYGEGDDIFRSFAGNFRGTLQRRD